jgi:hypothetical protein
MKFLSKLITMVVLATTVIFFQSCNKNRDNNNFPDPTPVEQTVYQSFGLRASTEVTAMNNRSWDKDSWTYNFSALPFQLKLTGVGNPNVYTQDVTVSQLKEGTVSINMLPGTYNVTYETIHTQAGDAWSINGTNLFATNAIGNVLDIKIQHSITVTGTPVLLTATLQDALIVVDIPSTNKVERYLDSDMSSIAPLLLNTVPTIHYGYVNKPSWLRIFIENTSPKILDMSMIMNGEAYHIITPFGATVNLIVPDMVVHEVVI